MSSKRKGTGPDMALIMDVAGLCFDKCAEYAKFLRPKQERAQYSRFLQAAKNELVESLTGDSGENGDNEGEDEANGRKDGGDDGE